MHTITTIARNTKATIKDVSIPEIVKHRINLIGKITIASK